MMLMYTFCCVEPASCLLLAGYLSSKPAELLLALLQFACTVVESGAAPSDVLTHYLPNLFGPGKVLQGMQNTVCVHATCSVSVKPNIFILLQQCTI